MASSITTLGSAISSLASVALPKASPLRRQAREHARKISIGRSAFLEQYGVNSELEYKQQSMRDGRIMYHAHMGLNDIANTSTALTRIHRELSLRNFNLDRAGFAFDRRMGLPAAMQYQAPAETGPMLNAASDWRQLAQTAPIQPHFGDFMIGQPASVENTLSALRVGCTTIGNLSQYFTFEAPGWQDTVQTAAQTYQAMSILAEHRSHGVMLHSYLEDGFGALFQKCSSVAAWAMLEYYLVENLIGARLSHCIGGLTSDPLKRAAWVLALQRIHGGDHIGSMIYGDTISFGRNFETNRAVTAEYLLWDIMAQLHSPSGHAVLPLPVTEAIRIPSTEEIIEAQLYGRQIETAARRIFPQVDFKAVEDLAETWCREGRLKFENAMCALREHGVDTKNPLQILYLLKRLGAVNVERLFTADSQSDASTNTDMFALSVDVIDTHRPMFADARLRARLSGKRFIVASSDVHAHAAAALAQLLSETGTEVIYLGAEQTPQDLLAAVQRDSVDGVLLSTHNGMALDYAKRLKQLLDAADLSIPVIMGGVLNQKTQDQALPIPVFDEIKALGMHPVGSLPGLSALLPS